MRAEDKQEFIEEMIRSLGIYYDPDHPDFIETKKKERLQPPFLEWYTDEEQFFADGELYYSWPQLVIRVYTDAADNETDPEVEETLRENKLAYKKAVEYIPEMSIRQTTYTMEV